MRIMSTIAASAPRSISLTKSLGPLAVIVSRSRSRAPRLMMLPARRAALTAIVSMGCMACDCRIEVAAILRRVSKERNAAILPAYTGPRP